MSRFGVDYAYGNGITVAQLKANGVTFVCRYLSGGSSKDISVAEIKNLLKGGIDVVLVWETSGTRALAGRLGGILDGRRALAELTALGVPGMPVYFAVDWDAGSFQQVLINSYLKGAATVLGPEKVGLYAGIGPISRAFDSAVIRYGWQTYAWSAGRLDGRAQLYQYSNAHRMGPTTVDYDKALATDFGQFGAVVVPPPPPPPPDPHPVLKIGSKGAAVSQAQTLLNTKRPAGAKTLAVDGDFGILTNNAVKLFQRANHLVIDGIVGPITWGRLLS